MTGPGSGNNGLVRVSAPAGDIAFQAALGIPNVSERASGRFVSGMVRYREFQREIVQRHRLQDGGIEKRGGDRRGSIAHVEFLGVGGKFVERPAPSGIRFVLVAEDVIEAHPAVRPDLAEGHGAFFKEPDKERVRDVEEVGRLLGRQFGVLAKHRDGAAGCHILENFHEEWAHRSRQLDNLFAVCTGDA